MVPWLLRSTDPHEGDDATLLVFSTSPNVNDHFYVKRHNGGINVKVVRPFPSPLQAKSAWLGMALWPCRARLLGSRGVCEEGSVDLLSQVSRFDGG